MQWGINTSSLQQTVLTAAQAKSEVFQGSRTSVRVPTDDCESPLLCGGMCGFSYQCQRVYECVCPVCVAEWGYQAGFGWPRACTICDCQRLGSVLLHQPLLAFWLTLEKWGSQNTHTNRDAVRQHTPDLLINTAIPTFLAREWCHGSLFILPRTQAFLFVFVF